MTEAIPAAIPAVLESGTLDIWAVLPAAGRGTRFGGDTPKQYLQAGGQSLLAHALDALLAHPRVAGVVVALAADDDRWPGWTTRFGKPVLRCEGGCERADSVLAALRMVPADGPGDPLVLVHDAARPNLHRDDLDRLIAAAEVSAAGAILAAPVRDTLKRADADACIVATEARDGLWRAMTPLMFRYGTLAKALDEAIASGHAPDDEATAIERLGLQPRLVEGSPINIKVTHPADLEFAALVLEARAGETP